MLLARQVSGSQATHLVRHSRGDTAITRDAMVLMKFAVAHDPRRAHDLIASGSGHRRVAARLRLAVRSREGASSSMHLPQVPSKTYSVEMCTSVAPCAKCASRPGAADPSRSPPTSKQRPLGVSRTVHVRRPR